METKQTSGLVDLCILTHALDRCLPARGGNSFCRLCVWTV